MTTTKTAGGTKINIISSGPAHGSCENFAIEYSYAKRPSWKSYGTGTAHAKLQVQRDGSLYVIASEWPEGIKGGKEVFFEIPAEVIAALVKNGGGK